MSDDGILKFSNAGGVSSVTRYPNFLTNYGDFGALQRIAYANLTGTSNNTFFSNIPQTYQDLMVVANVRAARTATLENICLGINGQTSIYSSTRLKGDGASATSLRGTNDLYFSYLGTVAGASSTSGIYGSAVFHILNYKTSQNKTILARTAADLNGSGEVYLSAGLIRYTSPISDIFVATEFTNTTGTIELFGVKASNA